MSHFAGFAWTTTRGFIKTCREESPRSRYINDLVERIKFEMSETGTTVLLHETLKTYVHPSNMDLTLTTINIFRFPFNQTSPPGNDYGNLRYLRTLRLTDSWNIMAYLLETLVNWKRLHEFLELADHVNQLATVFASVDQPELYWDRMHRLYNTPASESVTRFMTDMLRRRMFQAVIMNPPGKQPTTIDGNPINPEFCTRVQRAFWLHEFAVRKRSLELRWSNGQIQIPGNTNPATILEGFAAQSGDINVSSFAGLVRSQRYIGTMIDHGIEDGERLGVMHDRILRCHTLVLLGAQGLTVCLPKDDHRYSMQRLFQIAATKTQMTLFWMNFDFQSPFWNDGWFEKYPVSGPIENVSLGIDYSRREEEDPIAALADLLERLSLDDPQEEEGEEEVDG
ncbi:hypothetical protein IL306_009683 [Fusarium sp. DS 682]|nr:hypothetical protein IL306_009683 [Fusarium sp. DS 682]